jgi:hypothetical protein
MGVCVQKSSFSAIIKLALPCMAATTKSNLGCHAMNHQKMAD